MFDFYSATIFLSVFIMIIMDMLVSGNDLMEHDKKQTVYTISVLVIACMVSEWFGVWMDGAHPSLRTLHILVKTIELSTAPIITVLCSDLMTPLKHKKLIYTLIGVHAGLEVLSAFFGFIFSVDAQNVYHHETFYWVYVLAYASGVLLFIGQLLSESSHHYGLYRTLIIILPVFFFCGLFLQYGAGVRIMWACSAVDVLMVYILYSELTQKIDTLTHLLNRSSYESRLALLRGHADTAAKKYLSEFLRELTARRVKNEHLPHVSVGYACFNPVLVSVEDVIKRADRMMYHYKRKRKSEALTNDDTVKS